MCLSWSRKVGEPLAGCVHAAHCPEEWLWQVAKVGTGTCPPAPPAVAERWVETLWPLGIEMRQNPPFTAAPRT